MTRTELLYEGKAKRVYGTDDPTRCIIEFKDDATAFNGVKKGTIVDKGIMNNEMSSYLFVMLAAAGVGGERPAQGTLRGSRHHPGRLQAGVRARRRGNPPCRRDLAGYLPFLGQRNWKEAGQGPLPSRPGWGRGRLS